MNVDTKVLKSGSVKVIIYSSSDIKNGRIVRAVVGDIYKNINNAKKIVWVSKIKPNNGHTMTDVLKEFNEEYATRLNCVVLAQAGTLGMVTSNDPEDGLRIIKDEMNALVDSNFVGVVWNRCMNNTHTNQYITINLNSSGIELIESNIVDRTYVPGDVGAPILE